MIQLEALAAGMNEEIKRQNVVLNAYVKRIAGLEAENVLLRKIIEDMDGDQKLIASAAGIEDWSADDVVNKLSTSECTWCSEQKRISG